MTRAVLAIMSGLLCALAGMKHASALKAEAVRLHRWVQIFRHLLLLLQEGTMPIPEALIVAADGQAQPDRLLRETGARLQAEPTLSLLDAFNRCCPVCSEKEMLCRLFRRLGHGSKESRCLAPAQSAEEIALLAQNASARAEKDAKLWQTLGLTGGVCLTILLL